MTAQTMRAVRFHGIGGPEALRCEMLPVPEPGPGQVLVRVLAAGVNYADVMRRAGKPYPVPTPLPFRAGSEVAGEVCACGDGVDPAWLGRRVLGADIMGGGYAQYIALSCEVLLPWRAAGFSDFLALLIALVAEVAFFPVFFLAGATRALCAPARAFLVTFGC